MGAVSGHTPRPWHVVQEEGGWYVRAVAPYPDDWYICRLSAWTGAPGNGDLIVAAPDLLEAAKLTALHFERMNQHPDVNFMGDDEHEAWGALRAAILKAEGR